MIYFTYHVLVLHVKAKSRGQYIYNSTLNTYKQQHLIEVSLAMLSVSVKSSEVPNIT